MAYSELIKSFEKIRGYMREFYVYGFKSRAEYDKKSIRSYDNERRRIESWLGEYMSFRQDNTGKSMFISVDARDIAHNPLYEAFKAKSFTDRDITLHFYILDLLADGKKMSIRELADAISREYLSQFDKTELGDESTLRNKLKEYEALGLLRSEKQGRELVWSRCEDCVELDSWSSAISFYSEADPLGVIGSTLLDNPGEFPDSFRYKHYYLLHALNSEVLSELLTAMKENRRVEITSFIPRNGESRVNTLFPVKIFISTQTGRQYLLGHHYQKSRPMFFRVDNIQKIKAGTVEPDPEEYGGWFEKFQENLWGVSLGSSLSLDHVEMTIYIGDGESFVLDRLVREKRCGRLEMLDVHYCKFVADVYDAKEMLPWIRTFTGRIEKLECSNEAVTNRFYEDLETMKNMYGGCRDAVQ